MVAAARQKLAQTTVEVIQGDAEALPFADGSHDLVVSTSTLQWLDNQRLAFAQAHRIMANGALFVFALFGQNTLPELKECYGQACRELAAASVPRPPLFRTLQQVTDDLAAVGFCHNKIWREVESEWYADVGQLLSTLKRIGAGGRGGGAAGLSGRQLLRRTAELYQQRYADQGGIRASYEVIYGIARR